LGSQVSHSMIEAEWRSGTLALHRQVAAVSARAPSLAVTTASVATAPVH
jgi:hypothetical protein